MINDCSVQHVYTNKMKIFCVIFILPKRSNYMGNDGLVRKTNFRGPEWEREKVRSEIWIVIKSNLFNKKNVDNEPSGLEPADWEKESRMKKINDDKVIFLPFVEHSLATAYVRVEWEFANTHITQLIPFHIYNYVVKCQHGKSCKQWSNLPVKTVVNGT